MGMNRKFHSDTPVLPFIFMMLSIFSIFFDSTQFSTTDLELKHVQEDHDRLMERHSALLTVSEHLLIFEQAVWFLKRKIIEGKSTYLREIFV